MLQGAIVSGFKALRPTFDVNPWGLGPFRNIDNVPYVSKQVYMLVPLFFFEKQSLISLVPAGYLPHLGEF